MARKKKKTNTTNETIEKSEINIINETNETNQVNEANKKNDYIHSLNSSATFTFEITTPSEEENPKVIESPVEKTLNILFTHVSEGKNIDVNSWIVHHLNLGFSHIYILNIGDRISKIAFPEEFVSVINTNRNMSLEEIMKQSYNFSTKYKFDWMLYLRPNEYLNLSCNLNDLLSSKKNYDQVMINNRSIVNINSENKPNNCSNYYFTFLDMSYSYINGDLKNFVISK